MPRAPYLEPQELIRHVEDLRAEMLSPEIAGLIESEKVHPNHRASAVNLLQYLALRRHDIRQLQDQLAALGLSSLGRTEPHVLAGLCAVLTALQRLARSPEIDARVADAAAPQLSASDAAPPAPSPTIGQGAELLYRNTEALLGPSPARRGVRIMVTMPSEAATDYDLVRDLVLRGMDCMRINCAHDGPEEWARMIHNLRRAERETGRPCKVAMDIAGPKIRTGPLEPGPAVLKFRPQRDDFGRVTASARVWLTPEAAPERPPAKAEAIIPVPGKWLTHLKPGDRVRFKDARGSSRTLKISAADGNNRWAESTKTAYITPGLVFEVQAHANGKASAATRRARVGKIPPKPQKIQLQVGDTLILTRSLDPGRPAKFDKKGRLVSAARVGVTLPEFFDCMRPGDPVWLDDGAIAAVIREASHDQAIIEVTQTGPGGGKLGAEKGINVPESSLRISPLTPADIEALKFIVKNADIVGYSFVRKESDVRELQKRLAELGGENLGIILKIETREGFDHLPRLLLAAMRSRAVGVMIARGDLAIECGYQRLAEVQEEILWICEAAHMPVIWATQVLENLAKTGVPSRSEITDAAMGERAECVMLNKGPYIVDAVRILDDILRRMQAHQEKKRSMLRKLSVASAFRATA
jgi:pyruvate kinase